MTRRTRSHLLLALLGIAILAGCTVLSIRGDLQRLARGEFPEAR